MLCKDDKERIAAVQNNVDIFSELMKAELMNSEVIIDQSDAVADDGLNKLFLIDKIDSVGKMGGEGIRTPAEVAALIFEDMIHCRTKIRSKAAIPIICKPHFRFSRKTRAKTGYKIHVAGWYLDFRIVFASLLRT